MKEYLKRGVVAVAIVAMVAVLVISMISAGANPVYADNPTVFYNGLQFGGTGCSSPCCGWTGSGTVPYSSCGEAALDTIDTEWIRKTIDVDEEPYGGQIMAWDFSVYVPDVIGDEQLQDSYRFQVAVRRKSTQGWYYCWAYHNDNYEGYYSCTIDPTPMDEYDRMQVRGYMTQSAPRDVDLNKLYGQYRVFRPTTAP